MAEYKFNLDRKVTSWVREYHIIEADSLEEAKEKMIQSFHEDKCVETFDEQETLFETEEYLEPGDNGGYPTAELYYDDEMIADNTDKK